MTWPILPAVIISLAIFQRGSAVDWTPTVKTWPVFFTASAIFLASSMVCVIGFSQ